MRLSQQHDVTLLIGYLLSGPCAGLKLPYGLRQSEQGFLIFSFHASPTRTSFAFPTLEMIQGRYWLSVCLACWNGGHYFLRNKNSHGRCPRSALSSLDWNKLHAKTLCRCQSTHSKSRQPVARPTIGQCA